MTVEIGVLLGILSIMVVLFLTEKLPIDLTAFLGLATLTLIGFVPIDQAFSGFSSPAVITMLSVFIVSGGLQQTGVADMMGARVHRLVGSHETALIVVIMLVAGVLSAFMNNIAAAAVLMPAVGSIAHKAKVAPSRLFMPLAFGAILGGTTTMVGTPPNILAAELLAARGLAPFGLFDFTPLGLILLLGGTLFMATIGRRLLPELQLNDGSQDIRDLVDLYQLESRLFSIHIPADSPMDGRTLGEMRLGTTLRVQVVAILRDGRKQLAPKSDSVIRGSDVLLVEGRMEVLQELVKSRGMELAKAAFEDLPRPKAGVSGIRLKVVDGSSLIGKTLVQTRFRQTYGLVVLGIHRGEQALSGHFAVVPLEAGDDLTALGTRQQFDALKDNADFTIEATGLSAVKQLEESVYLIRIPTDSPLVGSTIGAGRLSELVGLTLAGIIRDNETHLTVAPSEVVRANDRFLVTGEPSGIIELLRLGEIGIDEQLAESSIESDEVGVVEATLTPRSRCLDASVAELHFRERYGMQVLAIWREGKPIRARLGKLRLRFGDALLLQGTWEHIQRLAQDPDFVVLLQATPRPPRAKKAPFALGGLLLMIGMVVTGVAPIHLAAFTAASVLLLLRTLSMEEAYRAIEWKAIFLVAAVLPAGLAMESTGAAQLMADIMIEVAGPLGPHVILAALVVLTSLLSQGLDGAPAVVLVTPVALQSAEQLGLSPYPVMMAVSMAASAAFMTPFSHKANLMVMGAGGYRTIDYIKVGTPLTILLLIVLVILIPVFFPI